MAVAGSGASRIAIFILHFSHIAIQRACEHHVTAAFSVHRDTRSIVKSPSVISTARARAEYKARQARGKSSCPLNSSHRKLLRKPRFVFNNEDCENVEREARNKEGRKKERDLRERERDGNLVIVHLSIRVRFSKDRNSFLRLK